MLPHLNFPLKKFMAQNPAKFSGQPPDIGWVVGHSYIIYGPLINRNTSIIFEGKPIMTPDAGITWRILSEYKVSVMFTAPTAIRAIKKKIRDGEFIKKYDLSHFRTQFFSG